MYVLKGSTFNGQGIWYEIDHIDDESLDGLNNHEVY